MSSPILETHPLGFLWPTVDPFLFCAHHDDAYPAGNEKMGPAASLAGRNLGQDFEGKDGWRMYHGQTVPGFPGHPHRGFETVTIVREGFIDHADSLGAAARFGEGDVQWLTAGSGVVHSEMFPLLRPDAPNPLELFQIWLNLPSANKMKPAYFSMLWNEGLPRCRFADEADRKTVVTVVAGPLDGCTPPAAPPDSWAARPEAHVAIWTIRMEPGARWTMPAAPAGVTRTLYFFAGPSLDVAGTRLDGHVAISLQPDVDVELQAGEGPVEMLLLQGRPIGETVAQYGPFVMNTRAELQQAFADYQRTRFGGWPWESECPVHPREEGRFARHADGRIERPAK